MPGAQVKEPAKKNISWLALLNKKLFVTFGLPSYQLQQIKI